jgi:hypothetical protein
MVQVIPEHKYARFKWLTIHNFSDVEWERFKSEMAQHHTMFHIDGIDEEERSICFKFTRFIPKTEKEIKNCLVANHKTEQLVLRTIVNNISSRIYFNAGKGIIKKLR